MKSSVYFYHQYDGMCHENQFRDNPTFLEQKGPKSGLFYPAIDEVFYYSTNDFVNSIAKNATNYDDHDDVQLGERNLENYSSKLLPVNKHTKNTINYPNKDHNYANLTTSWKNLQKNDESFESRAMDDHNYRIIPYLPNLMKSLNNLSNHTAFNNFSDNSLERHLFYNDNSGNNHNDGDSENNYEDDNVIVYTNSEKELQKHPHLTMVHSGTHDMNHNWRYLTQKQPCLSSTQKLYGNPDDINKYNEESLKRSDDQSLCPENVQIFDPSNYQIRSTESTHIDKSFIPHKISKYTTQVCQSQNPYDLKANLDYYNSKAKNLNSNNSFSYKRILPTNSLNCKNQLLDCESQKKSKSNDDTQNNYRNLLKKPSKIIKKTRTLYSDRQYMVLNRCFNATQGYLTLEEVKKIEMNSGLTVRQIRKYFANKRSRSIEK